MSPPQCGPVSVSSQSEASDKASVCQAWRRCGVVSAVIPLSQQSNSATSMVVLIASQASTIADTNNQRHVSLYFSTLCDWRRQRDAGALGALTPARRGPKALEANPLTAKVALLEKNNAHLMRSLPRAEAI